MHCFLTKTYILILYQFKFCSRGGGCSFEEKVKAATAANWTAAIVFNKPGRNELVPMAGEEDDVIPSVFMG